MEKICTKCGAIAAMNCSIPGCPNRLSSQEMNEVNKAYAKIFRGTLLEQVNRDDIFDIVQEVWMEARNYYSPRD